MLGRLVTGAVVKRPDDGVSRVVTERDGRHRVRPTEILLDGLAHHGRERHAATFGVVTQLAVDRLGKPQIGGDEVRHRYHDIAISTLVQLTSKAKKKGRAPWGPGPVPITNGGDD